MDKLNMFCYLSSYIKVLEVTRDIIIAILEEIEKTGIIAMIKL